MNFRNINPQITSLDYQVETISISKRTILKALDEIAHNYSPSLVEGFSSEINFYQEKKRKVEGCTKNVLKQESVFNGNQETEAPKHIHELLQGLALSKQSNFCQLETMFGHPVTLPKLSLPKSKGNFACIKKDGKTISLPKFIKIGGIRYSFSAVENVFVGGFSFVAFYLKSPTPKRKRKFSIEVEENLVQNLPDKIALKATRVDYEDFEKLFYFKLSTNKTTIGWLREFLVQKKLKFATSQGDDTPLPFAELFASAMFRLTPTTKRLQVFSVMEAGSVDFHSYFINCPQVHDICHSFDLNRRMSLVKLIISAGNSLSRLHDVGLHHGDVKLSNILINNTFERAMFTDFDGSVFLSEGITCDTYTNEYISPQRKEDDNNFDPFKDDAWAFGICLLKIITRRNNPLCELQYLEMLRFDMEEYVRNTLCSSVLPFSIQSLLLEVISGLLDLSEYRRLSPKEAVYKLSFLLN